MRNEEYHEGLDDFIETVFRPSESLGRIFRNGCEDATQPQSDHNDIGEVTLALAVLAKIQLRSLVSQLERTYGEIEVILPTEDMPVKVHGILPKK